MKSSQLNRGEQKRLMYIENKDGLLDGYQAWVGWVSFSKTGKSIYYKGRTFYALSGGGISGNFQDLDSGDEYWISGIKKRGSNAHPAERQIQPMIDADALEEYNRIRAEA